MSPKKQPYSIDFPEGRNPKRYLLDGIPAELWRDVRTRCKREGLSLRALLLHLLRRWLATPTTHIPDAPREVRRRPGAGQSDAARAI
jgi:hypothetical protein